jgi:hypothetical protein
LLLGVSSGGGRPAAANALHIVELKRYAAEIG